MNFIYGNFTQNDLKSILEYDPSTGKFLRYMVKGMKPTGFVHNGYITIKIGTTGFKAHSLAFLYMTGKWPKEEVDHINGNTIDNRWINLREATHSQNSKNRKLNIDSTSGFKGVKKDGNRWRADIGFNNKIVYLGAFDSPENAHAAYVSAASFYYGEFIRSHEHE